MNETTFDLASMRHLRGTAEAGSARDGQVVVLNLQMEDGGSEWVAMHHARVGRMVASMLFASGVAANDRQTASAQGQASEENSTLVEIVRVNAASAPGADHIVIRMVVGEGANLDFRIPLAVVPSLQDKISQAVAMASARA